MRSSISSGSSRLPSINALALCRSDARGIRRRSHAGIRRSDERVFRQRISSRTPIPRAPIWAKAPRVTADRNYLGEPIAGPPTEIRSRWTKEHLYLLYICPYDELNLKPDPDRSAETPRLWNWDVGEAFIGSDFEKITRYKEFQVSPQGEFVDLDIDRENPKGQAGGKWNSGFTVAARIDAQAKIWYGMMRIPFSAIDTRPPEKGRELRAGLYRIAGVGETKKYLRVAADGPDHVPRPASLRHDSLGVKRGLRPSFTPASCTPSPHRRTRGTLPACAPTTRRGR